MREREIDKSRKELLDSRMRGLKEKGGGVKRIERKLRS